MAAALRAKAGTILVVLKRLSPLKGIVTTLTVANFVVLQANSEAKAIDLATSHAESIDLLLADSELIGWSHSSVVTILIQKRPDLQAMFLCGEVVIGSFGCALIPKPFIPAKLGAIITAVLYSAETLRVSQQLSARSAR